MREYQIDLSSIPRDYLSKEEFYKVAHIRKATALWLLETGLVTAEKPERKGFGYKIPKAAVEHYLKDRSINPTKYRKSNRCDRYPYGPEVQYSREFSPKIRALVEQDIEHLSDVLVPQEVSLILGYQIKEIYEWHRTRGLKSLMVSGKLYIPKLFLLDFVASKEYHDIREKSQKHIELLRRVLHE